MTVCRPLSRTLCRGMCSSWPPSVTKQPRPTTRHIAICRGPEELKTEEQASLYVHWPYCSKRCTYCNFNKYISRDVDNERMTKCLTKEAITLIEFSGVRRINSIFFGGGTPSLAEPKTISKVIETVTKATELHAEAEVTLEVNPTRLETDKLREFRSAGVNRVSIGLQTLNDSDLKVLGREHSSQESIRCVREARGLFPGRVSVDAIFGRPRQTLDDWIAELHQILAICDNHISLYQLTLERGTQLFKWVHSGLMELPDSDTMADMYLSAVEILESHGFEQYEVSNFAKNGARSDHNQAYWTGQQYIGIGPGAHSRFVPQGLGRGAREERIQTLEPKYWMFEVERDGHATRRAVQQTHRDILEELLMLGLRTKEGLTHERWSDRCPEVSLWSVFMGSTVQSLVTQGFLILDHSREFHSIMDGLRSLPQPEASTLGLRTTMKGLAVLDAVLPDLLVVMETNLFLDSSTNRRSEGVHGKDDVIKNGDHDRDIFTDVDKKWPR